MIMKKYILALGLMFGALTLTNCSNYTEEEVLAGDTNLNGPKFELFAAPATRTSVIGGLYTAWESEDDLNVFHAVAGSTDYVKDGEFIISGSENLDGNRFVGTLAEELTAEAYDWYLLYPYSSYVTVPNSTATDGGYITIGCASNSAQTQDGLTGEGRLAGDKVPLYSIVKNHTTGEPLSTTMHHLSTAIEVVVTNNESEAISVSEITLTSSNEKLVGGFVPSFVDAENIVYTPYVKVYDNGNTSEFTANTVKLTATNATIQPGEKGTFYLVVKPFVGKTGESLTLKVTANDGAAYCSKTKEFTSDVTFAAGSIKTLNIGYTAYVPDYSGNYIILANSSDGTTYYALKGEASGTRIASVADFSYNGETSLVTSEEALVWTIAKSDKVYHLSNGGKYASYSVSGNTAQLATEPFDLTISENADGTFHISFIDSTNTQRYLSQNNNPSQYLYFAFYKSGQWKDLLLIPATVKALPKIELANTELVMASKDTDATIGATFTDYTALTAVAYTDASAATTSDWLTATATDGSINLTCDVNTGAERSAVVVVTATNDNGSVTATITVTQEVAAALAQPTITLDKTEVAMSATDTGATVAAAFTDYTALTAVAYTDASAATTSDWLTAVIADTNDSITLTCEANTGEARTAVVVVTATNANGTVTETIAVNQSAAGGVAGGEYILLPSDVPSVGNGYSTSVEAITAADGSAWSILGYIYNANYIQFGRKTNNYILTPECASDIKTITLTCSGSYYVAIWTADGALIPDMVQKPAVTGTDANGTTTFTLPAGHKQVKIISTRTTAGTGITGSNAATYISKIVVAY